MAGGVFSAAAPQGRLPSEARGIEPGARIYRLRGGPAQSRSVLFAATNSSGGVMGKMISPQNLTTGASVTDLKARSHNFSSPGSFRISERATWGTNHLHAKSASCHRRNVDGNVPIRLSLAGSSVVSAAREGSTDATARTFASIAWRSVVPTSAYSQYAAI